MTPEISTHTGHVSPHHVNVPTSRDVARGQTQSVPGSPTQETDTIDLSLEALNANRAREVAHAAPEMRTDYVTSVTRALEADELNLDSNVLAEKLISSHLTEA